MNLRKMPMLAVLVALCGGIIVGDYLAEVSWMIFGAGVVVCGVMVFVAGGKIGWIYGATTVVMLGAGLARIHAVEATVPQGIGAEMEVAMVGAAEGIVVRWNGREVNERVVVTGEKAEAGERMRLVGEIRPLEGNYGKLMTRRGYAGRIYIRNGEVVGKARVGWAKRLQRNALEKLERLGTGDEIAVAAAMTLGVRNSLKREVRQAYARTGTAHLLAVSGLHVGIIFLIINVLVMPLGLFRWGHIAKNTVAVAAVWMYAAMTGGSASAVRAAWMFTGAQAALATSQTRSAANVMCATGVVMLAVKPGLLWDISFQLSMAAVAGIMCWFGPTYALVKSRWRGLNVLWAMVVVGLVATVATMPLVAHTFGVFSPAGVALNPLIVSLAHVIIFFSVVWIAMPLPALKGVFEVLVGGPAWIQNRVVEAVATVPGAAIEWTMPLWGVWASYGVMAGTTIWLYARERKETEFRLER